jgi:hypothetical protein
MDKVFTCFDNVYFNAFGVAWIASLRTFGCYDGPIYAVSFNSLPLYLIDRLAKEKVFILDAFEKPKNRETVFDIIQKEIDGNFAYWDIDGYFLGSIKSLLINDKILFVKDSNGFFAGNKKSSLIIIEYNRLNDFCGFERNLDVYKYFPNSVEFLENEWNYQQANSLLPNNIKFLHFSGEIKNFIQQDICFKVKYPEIYNEWSAKFNITKNKKLFRKKTNE